MPGYVLDASALLALLHQEAGADRVRLVVRRSVISTINWSEVVQKVLAAGLALEERRDELLAIGFVIAPFDRDDAEMTAALWLKIPYLSLADRVCLALAARLRLPVLTADRVWQSLDIGVDVRLTR